eukprot:TRINITY_DN45681_c0_g2_i1.p1 TRINITY_DN45681_c0_g2~~TRINITY_DN45681_c0_g2_i1.p1  ORF type:complete len:300 (-),score=71.95 TRINITY_DN45681_c0_g2_i1:229-1128(-)
MRFVFVFACISVLLGWVMSQSAELAPVSIPLTSSRNIVDDGWSCSFNKRKVTISWSVDRVTNFEFVFHEPMSDLEERINTEQELTRQGESNGYTFSNFGVFLARIDYFICKSITNAERLANTRSYGLKRFMIFNETSFHVLIDTGADNTIIRGRTLEEIRMFRENCDNDVDYFFNGSNGRTPAVCCVDANFNLQPMDGDNFTISSGISSVDHALCFTERAGTNVLGMDYLRKHNLIIRNFERTIQQDDSVENYNWDTNSLKDNGDENLNNNGDGMGAYVPAGSLENVDGVGAFVRAYDL